MISVHIPWLVVGAVLCVLVGVILGFGLRRAANESEAEQLRAQEATLEEDLAALQRVVAQQKATITRLTGERIRATVRAAARRDGQALRLRLATSRALGGRRRPGDPLPEMAVV